MVSRSKWQWFGDPAHFIGGSKCQFHMATVVGKYLVSTVGRLWWERSSREITAEIKDPAWFAQNKHLRGDNFDNAYMKRFGYDDVGCDRQFETMVFKTGKRCDAAECGCGLPSIDGSELDFNGYNNAGAATRGHLAMCEKWSNPKAARARRARGRR